MPASDVTVEAVFAAIDYTITLVSSSCGTVSANKTSAHVGEQVMLSSTPQSGLLFKSYLVAVESTGELVEVANGNFTMPAANVTVSAIFEYEFHESPEVLPSGTDGTYGTSGIYVLFGDWPQTIKEESITVDEDTFIVMSAHTYYKGSDGYWYAKCKENAYQDEDDYNKYSDGTTVKQLSANSYKYFKVEPIKWRVLTDSYNGRKLLQAETILTAGKFYDYEYINRIKDHSFVYSNNYKESRIRAYLNGLSYTVKESSSSSQTTNSDYLNKGFLQTAFTSSAQALIATTTVDNSAASTTDANGTLTQATSYACADTSDKIFLLSEKEVTTSSYGFAGCNPDDTSRIRMTTDYAKANYANQSTTSGLGGWWWLRSPNYRYETARIVNYNGDANEHYDVYNGYGGVSPALSISF